MSQHKKSNQMYPWVDRKRNFIGGKCLHECVYCYVELFKKRWAAVRERYSGKPCLLEKELKKSEGSGHTIFIQDCGDLFANGIPDEWIRKVLYHFNEYPDNICLFQTKNPFRCLDFIGLYPPNSIFGVTIESNRNYPLSKAPEIQARVEGISAMRVKGFNVMVSVEPILDFDTEEFVKLLNDIKPEFVSIGSDSKGHHLPEPCPDKIIALKNELDTFTEVKTKHNLNRLVVALQK